jgi:hypothetical protein
MITANYRVLVPAYGRDYKSAAEAKADFLAGKDFVYQNFDGCTYCSVADFAPGTIASLRYKKLTNVVNCTVPAALAA